MIRTTAFALLLSGLFASPLALAQDSGFFLEARGGSASVDEDNYDDTTTAFEIGGGYRWGGFGVEAGYVTFNDFEDEFDSLNISAELDGWIVGGNLRFPFADQWYFAARGGLFWWSADADTVLCVNPNPGGGENCDRVGISDDDMDFYAGVGVGYDFSDQFSVGVAYDYFGAELEDDEGDDENLSTNVFWVTGELRFQ
jgi:OOP family OmpA-OmpF porin/outer membrane immunogenic protein